MGEPLHDQPTAAGALARGFLYDAAGRDREVDVTADAIAQLHDRAILWIDISQRDDAEIRRVGELLQLDQAAMGELAAPGASLPLDNYGVYLHFAGLPAPGSDQGARSGDRRESRRSLRIDFVVGRNWLLTVHDCEPGYLKAFLGQDKGDTRTGALSAAALTASLLDWHLEGYFAKVSEVEAAVDEIDERVLAEPNEERVLEAILAIRRRISRLRRTLIAQRSVFYGLSRPDLGQVADGGVSEAFGALPGRFDRAVDEVEHTRDLIAGSFELFTSRSAQQTNDLVRVLTFFTVIIGTTAAVAGLFGMNFDPPFFHTGSVGFLVVTISLLILALAALYMGRRRGWI